MVQIPITSGIYADQAPEYRAAYPVNMEPVVEPTGISSGHLRMTPGAVAIGTGPGVARGGIEWRGVCYRVMGGKFCRIGQNGAVSVIGNIPGTDDVTMTYSFDRLAIAGGGGLYYYDGSTFTQVTDPDLGGVKSVTWIDGYFVTTDGEFLVVTELNDPTAIDPLKYGSAEVDPDDVNSVHNVRGELVAVGRYTMETYRNVGGAGFPFSRVRGAMVSRGSVGPKAAALMGDSIAFVGSGRNEAVGVFMAANGTTVRVSTREIEKVLATFGDLSETLVEVQFTDSTSLIIIHLPDRTLCYDMATSELLQQPVWFVRSSDQSAFRPWRAKHLVRAYGQWLVADARSASFGALSTDDFRHFGEVVSWEVSTPLIFNEGRKVQIKQLELIALSGSAKIGDGAKVTAEYTADGATWSTPKGVDVSGLGARLRRLVWRRQGIARRWRGYRFKGDSKAPLSISGLFAEVEGLRW